MGEGGVVPIEVVAGVAKEEAVVVAVVMVVVEVKGGLVVGLRGMEHLPLPD
jgi:hypothetical protein